jgi:predicted HNH restriction endonuclease
MKTFWQKLIESLLGKNLPIWAYGLECHICQMTFIDEKAHYKHAKNRRLIKLHHGKIPIIKK